MSRRWPAAALIVLLLAAPAAWPGDALVPVPRLERRVTDLTGTLAPAQAEELEARLQAFEQRKGSQFAVLLVPTTRPEAIEQYALRVAEAWKVGRQRVDDGAILVLAKNDRTLRIEVGYGLEGVLNDATSKRIIEERIVPRLRAGDYYGGIAAGIDSMIQTVEGEPLPAPQAARDQYGEGGLRQLLPVALVLAIVMGAVLRALLGRVPGATLTGGIVGMAAWLLAGALGMALLAGVLAFLFTLAGGRRGLGAMIMEQGLRGGRGGGWGGGGGSFGGGGASGKW